MMRTLAGVLAVVVFGCAQRDRNPPLMLEAQAILERHCGACHVPQSPHARADALAVYALDEPRWYMRMTDAQLRKSVVMLGERVTFSQAELAEVLPGLPLVRPSQVEHDTYARFVEGVLAQRTPP
jgi:hypothetical protein